MPIQPYCIATWLESQPPRPLIPLGYQKHPQWFCRHGGRFLIQWMRALSVCSVETNDGCNQGALSSELRSRTHLLIILYPLMFYVGNFLDPSSGWLVGT